MVHRHLCASWLLFLALGLGGVARADQPIQPLPDVPALDARKVALGRALFNDSRFARDNSVSCVSCHSAQAGGADGLPTSKGVGGIRHMYNSPTVWNAALNFRQQWTGGSATLEELVDRVVKSPLVFDTTWSDAIARIGQDVAFVARMKESYPAGLTQATISDALATYMRTLLTPSRFDKYLRGDVNAITAEEKQGYARFKAYGCASCHQGVNVGGNMYQRFGALNDYFADRVLSGRKLGEADYGRFSVTRKEQDRHVFKVPSLRNVALTGPYFHDGSVETLEEAVSIMFRYQLGRTAPAADQASIIAFLKALSGQPPKE